MPVVAILPAAAVVIGAVIGIAVPTMPVAVWLATVVIAWIISVVAIVGRCGLLTIVACLVGFVAGAAALAQGATHDALEPAILAQSAPYRVDVAGSSGAVPVVIEADVVGDAIVTEFGAAMTVDVRRARDPPSSIWLASAGRVRITVAGNQVRERVGEWRAGRRIRAPVVFNAPLPYRNFGTIDQERRLALAGIRLFGSIKSASLVEVTHRANWLQETGAAARDGVRRAVATWVGRWDARSAAIVTAILIGDRAGLDAATESRLQRAGTYHVIAISGGNIAILVTLVTVVLRQAGVASRLQACLAIAIVLAYAAIVGSGASVARATLGATVYLCAQAMDHRSAALNILGVAVAAILVIAPLEVIDPAFWLTCVATFAILICAEPLHGALASGLARASPRLASHALAKAAIALLSATMAAEFWLLPVSAYAFSQMTFAGLVLNFAAIPLMAVAQIAGLALLPAAALRLTAPIAWSAGLLAYLAAFSLVESAGAVDLVPQVALRLPPPPLWLVIATEACGAACWLATRPQWRHGALAAWATGLLVMIAAPPVLTAPAASALYAASAAVAPAGPGVALAALAALADLPPVGSRVPCALPSLPPRAASLRASSPAAPLAPAADAHPGWLRLTSLDVAQGDATLIRWPDGATLMVDAGGSLAGTYDIGARIVSPALWALGLRRLDILALTHGDRDHIGGASAVLQDFRPRDVWEGVPVPTNALLAALHQQAAAQGTRWHSVRASAPSDARPDDARGARLRVWNPPADTAAVADAFQRTTVRNDDSIVLEIPFGRVSIVLPGDIGPDVERRLAADSGIRPAPAMLRILKAAHHGSGRSSTAAFLRALAPRIAIISAGRGNRFGHPAPATLDRLHAIGAAIFRTDEDGAIQIDTDGMAAYVTTCSGRTLKLR